MSSPELNPHNEMNGIIHHALRRDLARTAQVLQQPVSPEQRAALCRYIPSMLDYLHHHHVAEDEGVWPRTLAKRPDLRGMVDQMEAEHEALAAASDGLRTAASRFAEDGSDDQRAAFAHAVTDMQEATLPHLDHEEQVAMPLVLETLDEADWAYLEKHYFNKGLTFADQGRLGMWMLDDLDQPRAQVIRTVIPRPVLWLLERIYGGAYDRAARLRWGALAGTRS